MVLLRWLLKLVVLVGLTLCFLSLFQYGPGGFGPGLAKELAHWLPQSHSPNP